MKFHKIFLVAVFFGTVALAAPQFLRAQSHKSNWQNEWDKTIDAAKREGKVVVSIPTSAELRKEFDFVLIDTAAMSVSNDAISLGSFSDGVVMVLKANASRRETARQAIQDLQGGNARVLGAVLNQRTFPIPDTIYKNF